MTFADIARRTLGLDLTGVAPDQTLTDLGVTSKQLVMLVMRIEDELGHPVPFDRIAALGTVGSFEAYLSEASLGAELTA
jgi:acyl carrier protein